MTRWSTTLFLLVATFVGDFSADAISVPIQGQRRSGQWWQSKGGILANTRRDTAGIVDLQNAGDLQYYMNVTLGGREFRVLVDSGSADLWVAGEVPDSEATTHTARINYNDGTVQGDVRTATLEIEGYSIPSQAYIAEAVTTAHPDGQGILGLGPSRLSSILGAMGGPAGDPPLDRLFRQTTSLPSYISILLGRSNDPDSIIPGQLTIGEVLTEYGDVQNSPQLPIERIDWDQHWMVALDKGGIIGPDGQPVKASVNKQLKVIFDSGYTLPQVPKSVADAIYSRVPGAKYVYISATATPVWTLPCDVELNITFKFNGVSYPVHPLDTVMDDLSGPLDDNGEPTCVGAFQPMADNAPYDIILGMAFLRNAYILMSFGDFVDGSLTKAGEPFVQLRSLTDPAEAHEDFVQLRLGGVDTTGSQTLLPPNDDEDDNTQVMMTSAEKLKPYLPWIISATVLTGLLLMFGVAYFFVWRSGRRYRRLQDPAPSGLEESKSGPGGALKLQLSESDIASDDSHGAKELPNPYERDVEAALLRKTDAGDLVPNRRPYTTRSIYEAESSTDRLLPLSSGMLTSYDTTSKGEPLVSDDRPLPSPYADSPEATERLLPLPSGLAITGDTTAKREPLLFMDKPLPNQTTDKPQTAEMLLPAPSGMAASYDATSEGQPLLLDNKPVPLPNSYADAPIPSPPAAHDRPLPDPYAYGTPRLADVFDIARPQTASIYKLPPLEFSAASLLERHSSTGTPRPSSS
ncbi:acid protease [Trametes cingulata]|nr:acid protease [Trametes cingulata]